jgi:hypothetical protein
MYKEWQQSYPHSGRIQDVNEKSPSLLSKDEDAVSEDLNLILLAIYFHT